MSYERSYAAPYVGRREISTAQLLGQVSFLVAIALGFAAAGGIMGKDLAFSTARILSFAGFGMLIVSSFAPVLRRGPVAMAWLFATALVIGLGIGPFLDQYMTVQPDAVTEAAGGTALTVAGMGALGFAMSKDLSRWMRPLSIAILGLIGVSILALIFSTSLGPLLSLAIYGVSAALILVDFNYLRRHGTEDDVVWLATGIFVSIVNIFLTLLDLFGRR